LTIAAFVSLNRAFGVFPALRGIVIRGPYQFVRHPAYAGELTMAAACFVAGPTLLAASAWLLLLPGVAWRIVCEERILTRDEAYTDYRQQVPWRLVPLVW
jgi:protein-S-isoprenylcysteine O-methyltransferase Ste14